MKLLSLVTLAIAVTAIFAMLDQDSGIAIWRELRGDLETSNERVEQLLRENDALRGEIAILESEPAALDRAIREELDLVLPGEVVVRFEPARPVDSPAESSSEPRPDDRSSGDFPDKTVEYVLDPAVDPAIAGNGGAREVGESL